MPSGAGPAYGAAFNVTLPANTTENVLATLPASNWNNPQGIMILISAMVTGGASGTFTLRLRQGSGTGGTQVGPSIPVALTNGPAATINLLMPDTTAFGLAQNQGQYTLTYQQSANSLGTVNQAVLQLQTVAPVQ